VSCASDALRKITKAIKENRLNRVVVSACTPKDHEEAFRGALREAGLNPYLLDMANIREQCTWVHYGSKDEANQKAKEIIAMSVARARNLCPIEDIKLPINKKGLVVGGGLAGMKAALSLARQGFKVYLVEKNEELGGQLTKLHYTLDGREVGPFLRKLRSEVESEKNVEVFRGYELKSCAGYVGNFKSTLASAATDKAAPVELEHGIVIVATGGKILKPTEYRYGESKKVATQQELEQMIASDSLPGNLKQVAMIQCVGARNEQRTYCSRICCGQAIKNALKIKELNESTEVVIFYRDIRAYGFREDYYLHAREKGILFIQYEPERKPEVDLQREDLSLTFYDSILEMEGELNPDLLVLSTPVVPEGNQELSQLLRVSLTGDGFFMEAHMKLRPLDVATDGIFLCGMAHYPKYIPETINQADGAALRAATILSQDSIIASGAVCEIAEDECISCGACISVCMYGAIEFYETPNGKKARINPVLCKGDGLCNSKCPTGAVSLRHFIDEGITAQIDSAFQA
jgi:heterodisulfide reductase subunit A